MKDGTDHAYWVWARRAAEVSSVVGFAAFIAALTINTLLFATWGLNFLQLASVGDVMFSAISILFYIMPGAIFVFAGWIFLYLPFRPSRQFLIYILTCILLAVVTGARYYFRNYLDTAPPLLLDLMGFFFCGILIRSLFDGAGPLGQLPSAFKSIAVVLLVAVFAVLILLGWRASVIGLNAGVEMISDECSDPASVLWTGSRSVVARCNGKSLIVVVGPENVILKTRSARP